MGSTTAALTGGAAILTGTGTAAGSWNAHVKAVGTHATVDPSAVAVVNYQFEIGDTDNAELATIIGTLPNTGTATTTLTNIDVSGYNMSALLNPDNTNMLEDYYYYDGSLTLPSSVDGDRTTMGCNEIVRWLIPTTKLSLSATQLDAFQGSDIADAIHLQQGASLARAIQTNANLCTTGRSPPAPTSGRAWPPACCPWAPSASSTPSSPSQTPPRRSPRTPSWMCSPTSSRDLSTPSPLPTSAVPLTITVTTLNSK